MLRNKSQLVIKDQGRTLKEYNEIKKKQDKSLSRQVITMKSMEHVGYVLFLFLMFSLNTQDQLSNSTANSQEDLSAFEVGQASTFIAPVVSKFNCFIKKTNFMKNRQKEMEIERAKRK